MKQERVVEIGQDQIGRGKSGAKGIGSPETRPLGQAVQFGVAVGFADG